MPRPAKKPKIDPKEKALELRKFALDREFNCSEDKRDAYAIMRSTGMRSSDIKVLVESCRLSEGRKVSVSDAYKRAINIRADQLSDPNLAENEKQRQEEFRQLKKSVSYADLMKAAAGRSCSMSEAVAWVASNLLWKEAGLAYIDQGSIPSTEAVSLLAFAHRDEAAFRQHYDAKRMPSRAMVDQALSMGDSGRDHEELMKELIAARDLVTER